jgi:hypothetical protein
MCPLLKGQVRKRNPVVKENSVTNKIELNTAAHRCRKSTKSQYNQTFPAFEKAWHKLCDACMVTSLTDGQKALF